MKVLFAHDHRFIPHKDNVYSEAQFSASMWRRYLAHFDEVVVAARRGAAPSGKNVSELEVSSAQGVCFEFVPDLSNPSAQLLRRKQATALMREQVMRADAVIARLPSEVGLLAVAEARKAARPFAIEVAGCGWDSLWNHGNWQGKVYAPVMTLRMKLAVAESAHSLYVTREFLQRRYPCRQGNTVSCSNVEIPAPDRHVLERRLERMANRTDSPVVLGLIGTLRTRYKGIQTVMEALSRVRAELPPVIFRVLGGGDAGPWKEEAAKFGVDDLVVFDGTRPVGEPVLQWLDEVDLYLQPSFQEGLPRALIEAMSRACPALASTCAGIPELLEGDCLVRPGDAKSLGQLLVESVNNREWQFRQSQRNWSEAAHYSRDVLEKRRFDFLAAFAAEAAAQGRLELSTG